jgi:hypothetical protein
VKINRTTTDTRASYAASRILCADFSLLEPSLSPALFFPQETQQPYIFTFLVNDVGLMDSLAFGREFKRKPKMNRRANYHFASRHHESTLELIHP